MKKFLYTIVSVFCGICAGMHTAMAVWDLGRVTLSPAVTIPSAILLFAGFVYFGDKALQ